MERILSIANEISIHPLDSGGFVSLGILLGLLLLSGMISASEVSFFSLDKVAEDILEESKSKSSKIVLKLKAEPEKLLGAVLILNNLINVGIVVLSSYVVNRIIDFGDATILSFIFQTIVITFLLLLFGEILPKIFASSRPLNVALFVAPIFPICIKILAPFIHALTASTTLLTKRLEKHRHAVNLLSTNDLSEALQLTDEISEDKTMLEGIIRFGKTSVVEVMTSRKDVVAVSIESNFRTLLTQIKEEGFSRMPVYGDSRDDIRGILYIKDLLPHLRKPASFRWQTLVRPAYFVPETQKIDDLLSDFQKNKYHIAIVVDEFGGTSGIITMEDILEEIVGEIQDEYDDEELGYKRIGNNTIEFEAKISLGDFFRIAEINQAEFAEWAEDVPSLGGLLLEFCGEIPTKGQVVEIKNYRFEILQADSRHIETVLFSKNETVNTAMHQ